MRRWLAGLLIGSAVASATPQLMVNGWRDARLLGATRARPGLIGRFDRIHIVALAGNSSIAPTSQPELLVAKFAADPGLVPAIAEACQASARSWAPVADLLQYPAEAVPSHWPSERPRDLAQSSGAVAYLSPWAPAVRRHLSHTLAEWSGWSPPPSQLTLALHLQRETIFGYSEPARGAYIRDRARDPIDLLTSDEIGQWATWREEQLAKLLQELVDGYLAKRPRARITAWGTGDLPIRDAKQRCASADNWLLWLEQGIVQEVILDTTWEPERTKQIWGTLRQLSLARLKAEGKSFLGTAQEPLAKLRPLVQHVAAPKPGWFIDLDKPTPEPKAWTIAEQVASLRAAGAPVENAVYYPHSVDELDEVLKMIGPAGAGISASASGGKR